MFVVHCKPGCIFCVKAKEFLTTHQLPFSEMMYNPEAPDYTERRDILLAQTRHTTFPQIFFGDQFLGGFQELQFMFSTGALGELCSSHGIFLSPPLDF